MVGKKEFQEYVLTKVVPEDKKEHIINFQRVEIPKPYVRTENEFRLKSKLKTGELIEVNVKTKYFEKENRTIKYKDYGPVDSIDGQVAYFGDSIPTYPLHETEFIDVKIDDKKIDIDKQWYSNYFDIHITKDQWVEGVGMNVIYDESTGLFHLIFGGGSVSGTYWAKLIFDKNGIVETYVLDYIDLSEHGCFYSGFTGF